MSVRHWKAARARPSPAAYSPRTGLFYLATNNMCMDYQATRATRIAGTTVHRREHSYHAGRGGQLGAFIAWDAGAGKKGVANDGAYPSGAAPSSPRAMSRFYGTLDGWFKAADAKTGQGPVAVSRSDREWWATRLPTRDRTASSTWRLYAGIGGDWFLLAGDVRSDDPADVRPPADFMSDIARHTSQGGIVWIFAL